VILTYATRSPCKEIIVSDTIASLVTLGRETREVEYKRSAPWNDIKDRIARTAMGMANLRGGGTIVLGMDEAPDGGFVPRGISNIDVATYSEDEIASYINRFADPYVRIELHRFVHEEHIFLAIVVHEFDEIPVVCKRDGREEMRQGAVYVRSRRIAETSEVRSQTEMREVIAAASEKGARRLLQTIHGFGLSERVRPSDDEQFALQLEGLREGVDSGPVVLQRILPRAYWHVVIRPCRFVQKRIASLTECVEVIETMSVFARNRHIPLVEDRGRHTGADWVAYGTDRGAGSASEYWRFYQSAQLVGFVTLYEDGIDERTMEQLLFFTPVNLCPERPPGFVSVENCLWMTTEFYEVAARLAQRASLDGEVSVSICMKGIEKRMLFFWDRRFIRGTYQSQEPEIQHCTTMPVAKLLEDKGELAIKATAALLEHFGWMPPPIEMLRADQHEFMQKHGFGVR